MLILRMKSEIFTYWQVRVESFHDGAERNVLLIQLTRKSDPSRYELVESEFLSLKLQRKCHACGS